MIDTMALRSGRAGTGKIAMPMAAGVRAPNLIAQAYARLTAFGVPDPAREPAWSPYRLAPIRLPDGSRSRVSERTLVLNPFSVLLQLSLDRAAGGSARSIVLIVAPMSGHFTVLLHDLVAALLPRHDVHVLEWINARHIPAAAGGFGLDGTIDAILSALRLLGPGAHVFGICQSAVPAIAAAVAASDDDGARPASLVLLGGPVDPAAHPSHVSIALEMTPLSVLAGNAVRRVAAGFEGVGRPVFPAEIQQANLMRYLTRRVMAGSRLTARIASDDGGEIPGPRFLDLYARVKDVPAEAFLDSIDAVFHRRLLWSGGLRVDARRIEPERVTDLPLMTVEAPEDDISPPGQTRAAHRLFTALPDHLRASLTLPVGDHFSLFHGSTCRNEVVPAIEHFWARTGALGRHRHRRDWLVLKTA